MQNVRSRCLMLLIRSSGSVFVNLGRDWSSSPLCGKIELRSGVEQGFQEAAAQNKQRKHTRAQVRSPVLML